MIFQILRIKVATNKAYENSVFSLLDITKTPQTNKQKPTKNLSITYISEQIVHHKSEKLSLHYCSFHYKLYHSDTLTHTYTPHR